MEEMKDNFLHTPLRDAEIMDMLKGINISYVFGAGK